MLRRTCQGLLSDTAVLLLPLGVVILVEVAIKICPGRELSLTMVTLGWGVVDVDV